MSQAYSLEIKPHELTQLVQYNEGSVVSREIIRTEHTTVTLFAFAEKQGLSEHTTPYTALVQVIDGEAKITVGGIEHLVSVGQMLIMPANTPHALYADKVFKMVLTMAR